MYAFTTSSMTTFVIVPLLDVANQVVLVAFTLVITSFATNLTVVRARPHRGGYLSIRRNIYLYVA